MNHAGAQLGGLRLRGPVMAIERPGVRGLVAIAPVGKLVLMHAGRQLPISTSGSPLGFTPSLGPIALALDDDTIVPKPEWDGVLRSDALVMIEPVEREFCATIVAALEGASAQLDESGSPVRVSLASIRERYPAPRPIPMLSSAPGFETLEWHPVILAEDGMERAAFQGWSGGRAGWCRSP